MQETDIMRRLMKLATNLGSRVFRVNTGQAWVGTERRNRDGSITLSNPRPVHMGLVKGGSDLIGFTPITITQDMVGNRLAVFTAVEVKTPSGRPTAEQRQFIEVVQRAGGYAGIARNDEDLTMILCPDLSRAQGVDKITALRNGEDVRSSSDHSSRKNLT
jgi:hypothetical protein